MHIRDIRAIGLTGRHAGRRVDERVETGGQRPHPRRRPHRRGRHRRWAASSPTPGWSTAALGVLEPLWRGENALEPERVSEKLHQHTFWMGRGGTLTHAISGIDIALWDILGKATGQPVGRLLGGRYRERVRALRLAPDGRAGSHWPTAC